MKKNCNDCYYSEFNSDSCIKVLYTKKDKFATQIAYVQDKILPQPQKLYKGMPVTPVTNSRSAHRLRCSHNAMERQKQLSMIRGR